MIKNIWNKVKDWFKRSETILIARLEALLGLIIAAIGAFDVEKIIDLFNAGVSHNQVFWFGAAWFVKGLVQEWARRRNSTL